MSKTPYELRTEVLAMAKDYMDKQMQINVEYTNKMIELGKEPTMEDIPKMYSPEELMKQAREFYSFVGNKGD